MKREKNIIRLIYNSFGLLFFFNIYNYLSTGNTQEEHYRSCMTLLNYDPTQL